MAFERGPIHIDKALTNISVQFRNTKYISDMVFPIVTVNKDSDLYYVYGKEHFRVPETNRADGTPSNEVKSWSVSTGNYSCKVHSLKDKVTDRERAQADNPLIPRTEITNGITDILMLRKELDIKNAAFSTTTFGAGYNEVLSGSNQWSDYTNSKPIDKVKAVMAIIEKRTGIRPNSILINAETFDILTEHPQILEKYKYTQPGVLTPALVAKALNIENLIVGSAVINTAKEGATPSVDYVWTKNALIYYKAPRPSLRSPSLGYSIHWNIYGNGKMKVKSWRQEDIESEWIEVSTAYDNKIVAKDSGYLLRDVIA